MFLGEIIKKYRNENQISMRDFAKRCNLSHTYIAALEKNIDSRTGKPIAPTLDTVKHIAVAINMNIDELLKILDDEQEFIINNNDSNYFGNFKQVFPLLGIVKAGYDYLAAENIIGHISIDKELSDPENYFALKITGDSMQPVLYEDDIIIVHKQNDVESGQIGIILIDDEEATVKKVVKHNDYIELIAFNSYYPPKLLSSKNKFKIIKTARTKVKTQPPKIINFFCFLRLLILQPPLYLF